MNKAQILLEILPPKDNDVYLAVSYDTFKTLVFKLPDAKCKDFINELKVAGIKKYNELKDKYKLMSGAHYIGATNCMDSKLANKVAKLENDSDYWISIESDKLFKDSINDLGMLEGKKSKHNYSGPFNQDYSADYPEEICDTCKKQMAVLKVDGKAYYVCPDCEINYKV